MTVEEIRDDYLIEAARIDWVLEQYTRPRPHPSSGRTKAGGFPEDGQSQ